MGKKSVNDLYEPMLEHSNVEDKFHKAAKGKTERPDVAAILNPENIQQHVEKVIKHSTGMVRRTESGKSVETEPTRQGENQRGNRQEREVD